MIDVKPINRKKQMINLKNGILVGVTRLRNICNMKKRDSIARVMIMIALVLLWGAQADDVLANENNDALVENSIEDQPMNEIRYSRYYNARFHFQVEVPTAWYFDGIAPVNNDGRSFTDGNNIHLDVFASHYFTEYSLSSRYKKDTHDPDKIVTYMNERTTGYVVSGLLRGEDIIFYKRVFLSKKRDVVRTLYVTYPKDQAYRYNPVVEHMVGTFIEKTRSAAEDLLIPLRTASR